MIWRHENDRHDATPSRSDDQRKLVRMSGRITGSIAVATLIFVAGGEVVLWWAGTNGLNGVNLVSQRFDALKIGLASLGGAGALVALYINWRRQRSTEVSHDLQREVASAAESDALARRITDLYTTAASQLGADSPTARLAGIYSLERLAQVYPDQRQTIVNLMCAYLRMPHTPPQEGSYNFQRPITKPTPELVAAAQEQEVRLAAQRILTSHLRPHQPPIVDAVTSTSHLGSPNTYWDDIDLDLSGAVLVDLDFTKCRARVADFRRAIFLGDTRFISARFTSHCWFSGAQFADEVRLMSTTFDGQAHFERAVFSGVTQCSGAKFMTVAGFAEARFDGDTDFRSCEFGQAQFPGVTFDSSTSFDWAKFHGDGWFSSAIFNGAASFQGVEFKRNAWFGEAPNTAGLYIANMPERPYFLNGYTRTGISHSDSDTPNSRTSIAAKIRSRWTTGAVFERDADFNGVRYGQEVSFAHVLFCSSASFEYHPYPELPGYPPFHPSQGDLSSVSVDFSGVDFEQDLPPRVATIMRAKNERPGGDSC